MPTWVPAGLTASPAKLHYLCPSLFPRGLLRPLRALVGRQRRRLALAQILGQLQDGDCSAASVASLNPLLVAAYVRPVDCVVMLRFPQELEAFGRLSSGARLLSVQSYLDGDGPRAPDLIPGNQAAAADHEGVTNVAPYVAEFLSDDLERIAARKEEIDEREWARCFWLGKEYLKKYGLEARPGDPLNCTLPAW